MKFLIHATQFSSKRLKTHPERRESCIRVKLQEAYQTKIKTIWEVIQLPNPNHRG